MYVVFVKNIFEIGLDNMLSSRLAFRHDDVEQRRGGLTQAKRLRANGQPTDPAERLQPGPLSKGCRDDIEDR